MSIEITVIPREGYLHVRVQGLNSPENVIAYLSRIQVECRAQNCFRVLIEENLKGPGLDLVSIFNITSMHADSAYEELFTIAIVDLNPEHDFENMKFAETVAINRAGNVRAFQTLPEAEEWIKRQAERH